MDMTFSAEDLAFRDEVRAFLDRELPQDLRGKHASLETADREAQIFWQKKLAAQGWLTPNWPEAHGGCNWTPTQNYLFSIEMQKAAPPLLSPFGVTMCGPVIYTYGSEDQKARFLPGIQSGETLWCQGYSEPGSGSDLASLKTKADRDGEDYIVNGQKIWTSFAHWAEWIFCLVRTKQDGKPQEGISFLLIDMKSPGVTVKPIVTIDGEHHLNEVFFEDVRVPMENRVGEENMGWTYAKFLLTNERAGTAGVAGTMAGIARLKAMAAASEPYAAPMAEDPSFRTRLSQLEMDTHALEYTELRALSAAEAGGPGLLELSSPLKLRGTELQQRLADLAIEFFGQNAGARGFDGGPQTNQPAFLSEGENAMKRHLFGRAATIYGGSSEVQKNIMAKAVLGL